MKITIVTQNYYPFVGGVEIHARQVAHELSQEHQVDIVATNFAPSKLPTRLGVLGGSLLAPACADFDDEGVPVHALTPSCTDRIRMVPLLARAVPVLSRYGYHALNRKGYSYFRSVYLARMTKWLQGADVVHCLAFGYLGWVAQEAARRLKIPFVCTPFVHPQQWGDSPEDIAYYRRCDGIIALVNTDRDYLRSIGVAPAKIYVIGVSPDLPATADAEGFRRRHGLEDVPVVLYVGRMMAQKGAASVVAAAGEVWKQRPDVRFVFIGPGSDESDRWFEGADARILSLGKVSREEKNDALAACDVFCMPSMSEILPTVYLEAWSHGKPVVGGQAHGLTELVEGNGAGFNCEQDALKLGVVLEKLLQDSALRARLGRAGQALVERKYSVRAVTAALLSLYLEVSAP